MNQFDHSECGSKHTGNAKKPIDFFYLMFRPVLWRILVEETNRYAKTHNTSNWKDVTTAEMKGFLSVTLNMGLIKRNKLNDFWKIKYESQSTPWFRKMFNCSRFLPILHSFHIVDNDKLPPKTDPFYRPSARIRPLLDYINSISMYYYQPFENISIDESLVGSKSRNPIRQYLTSKHHTQMDLGKDMLLLGKWSWQT